MVNLKIYYFQGLCDSAFNFDYFEALGYYIYVHNDVIC